MNRPHGCARCATASGCKCGPAWHLVNEIGFARCQLTWRPPGGTRGGACVVAGSKGTLNATQGCHAFTGFLEQQQPCALILTGHVRRDCPNRAQFSTRQAGDGSLASPGTPIILDDPHVRSKYGAFRGRIKSLAVRRVLEICWRSEAVISMFTDNLISFPVLTF